jgi:predicted CoA-binding protein
VHVNDLATIARLRRTTETWAVVGCSPDPGRTSHRIAAFLQRDGYRVIPVNPTVAPSTQILGEVVHPDLASIPEPIDVVDVFRRSSQAGAVVDEAIAVGAGAVWLQVGVIDEAAAERAEAAGLDVVMDTCPLQEFPGLARS